MKRRLAIALAAAMTVSLLAGCGASQDVGTGGGSTSDGEQTEAEMAVEDDAELTPAAYYITQGTVYDLTDDSEVEPSYNYYEQYYSITMYDDGSALFDEDCWYANGVHTTTEYVGTYDRDGDRIVFKNGDTENADIFSMTVSGDNISNIQYGYYEESKVTDIIGTYTGETEYGDATLTVNEDGSAVLDCGDSVFSGSIFSYDDMWDFMANTDDDSLSVDWIVEFDGESFTYVTYASMIYGGFAGTYEITGDLGEILLTVDENGNAEADITVYGDKSHLTGTIQCDSSAGLLTGVYMQDDRYALDAQLDLMDDGTYNYYGTITVQLSAG